MSKVTVVGGAICGLLTGLLLADDGHDVVVLERDPAPTPNGPDEAWQSWERKGVPQFRIGHLFLCGFRQLIERELPAVGNAIEATGALRFNILDGVPDEITGGRRDDDDRFEILTGRRPVVEAAIAGVAESHPRIEMRRGVAVEALVVERGLPEGIAHVAGVRTSGGETIASDIVVDATGRRSPMARLLAEAECAVPEVESEDSGFVYYGRTFRSQDGSTPPAIGGPLQHYNSISILTLAADNGTWFVGVVAAGRDAPLRALNDNETWMRLVGSYPLVAHWIDAEPITDVVMMAKIEDKIAHYLVDGQPVASGVVAVGDAYACTNPSLGRGASIGLINAVALRDALRQDPAADPTGWTRGWLSRVESDVEPWYRETLALDHHRLAQIEADVEGSTYECTDPFVLGQLALGDAAFMDPDIFRAQLDIALMLRSFDDVSATTDLVDRALKSVPDEVEPAPGPNREELLEILT